MKKSLKKIFSEQTPYPQQISDFSEPIRKPISLDQMVDKYLVRYEKESIPLEGPIQTELSEIFKEKTLKRSLLEQEQEKEETEPETVSADAASSAPKDLFGDVEGDGQAVPIVNTPKINLDDFSRAVARLLNNFDSLLNPKTIIFNRAEAYIKANYNEKTANEFVEIMKQNYGIEITNTNYGEEENIYPEPVAAAALLGADGGSSGAST